MEPNTTTNGHPVSEQEMRHHQKKKTHHKRRRVEDNSHENQKGEARDMSSQNDSNNYLDLSLGYDEYPLMTPQPIQDNKAVGESLTNFLNRKDSRIADLEET